MQNILIELCKENNIKSEKCNFEEILIVLEKKQPIVAELIKEVHEKQAQAAFYKRKFMRLKRSF